MTETTLIGTPDDIPAEILEQMLRVQVQFDATRPACPKNWCDGTCENSCHFGDAVLHSCDVAVSSTSEYLDHPPGTVTVTTWRDDSSAHGGTAGITVDVSEAATHLGDSAVFTATQARNLAAELLAGADRIDPAPQGQIDVPAPDVQVGDRLQVGGFWLHLYSVLADEPSGNVQINVTVDPAEWPELDGDEEPHCFKLTDTVRVLRATGSAGGSR